MAATVGTCCVLRRANRVRREKSVLDGQLRERKAEMTCNRESATTEAARLATGGAEPKEKNRRHSVARRSAQRKGASRRTVAGAQGECAVGRSSATAFHGRTDGTRSTGRSPDLPGRAGIDRQIRS